MENRTERTTLKRFLAFVFDSIFIILLSFTLTGIMGLFFRIDSYGFQIFMWFLISIMIIAYLFFGELILKNTLGKYLTGIETIDNKKFERPSTVNFIKRGLLKIIWPIEALVLLFSNSKKRLGDLWAKTLVVNKESNHYKPVIRLVIGIVSIVILYFSFSISMGLALMKTDFYKIGKLYLNNISSLEVIGLPKEVNQSGNLINFTVPINDKDHHRYAEIFLEKTGNKWNVYYSEFLKNQIIIGFSYSFNPSASMKREYFANGKLKSEGIMLDSKKEGTWKFYKEEGQLEESTIWHNDKQLASKP